MTTYYVPTAPPPSAAEIMETTAKWVARLYGAKVTVTVESSEGETHATFDHWPQRQEAK